MRGIKLFFQKIIKKSISNEKSSIITSLAPKVITDEKELNRIKPYLDTLKEAIESEGRSITNIAITGAYGSGKSTIIKTFQHFNDNYKFLNISLASFKDAKDGDRPEEKLEKKLEISILQQIFYRVKPSEIPDSRFKRIINIPWWKLAIASLFIVLWIFTLISILKFNYFENLNPQTWDVDLSFDWIIFLSFIILLLGIGITFYKLISIFINSRINKINIKGELELGSRIDKSVFNEYLEEILYFFEKTKFDIVVIEDIDRFSTTEIFTKLRELNILINNSDLIKRKVVFIYAIRDEVFLDKLERVKFFDFIIPIISFINPTNASEQLTSLIKSKSLTDELSKEFTDDLVSYIDDIDMRLLINIFNEYLVYKENLNLNGLVQENLFSIIVYKNTFPDDFGKLQKREGILYEFINNKSLYTKKTIEKIENEIINIEEKIEKIEKELDISIRELRSIYLIAFKKIIPNALSLYFEEEVHFKDMLDEGNFEKLQSADDIKYVAFVRDNYYDRYNKKVGLSSSKDFKSIETEVNDNLTFEDRLNNIESKSNDKVEVLRGDIEKLRRQKNEINSWELKDILNKISIEEIVLSLSELNHEEFKADLNKIVIKNNLMRYVLWNGYINESYADYITLFHEVDMTSEEFSFVRKVKVGESLQFDYKLINLSKVIKKIPLRHYQFDPILNFNLIDFILTDSIKYSEHLSRIMELLSNEKAKSVEFIDKFIELNSINVGLFIEQLSKKWVGFWSYIVDKSNFRRDKKNNYLKLIIEYADLNSIYNLNKSGKLSESIKNTPIFLNMFKGSYYVKLKTVVEYFNIKFVELENPTDDSLEIFRFVYNKNYYKINEKNITLFLNVFDNFDDFELLSHSNYTVINNSTCNNLKKYIEDNIEEYVKNVLLQLPNNISETEENVIDLLNNENLTDELKKEIIKKQTIVIEDLFEIDSILIQKNLFQHNKIYPSWENIMFYYDNTDSKFDDTLIGFMNVESNYSSLSQNKLILT